MPDPFEMLLVVPAGARGISDNSRIENAVAGEGKTEGYELRPPVTGMAA
jgi:hypothetical protein